MSQNPAKSDAAAVPASNIHSVFSPAVSSSDIHSDTPELDPLLSTHPDLRIYTKSSPHFEDVRVLFNREITTIPRAIIRPRDESELISTVVFCTENGLPMSVRSGGHDLHGRCLIADGIVIDMRAFDEVKIVNAGENASGGSAPYAAVGPGVISGKLLRVLDENKLVTPVGWCDEVCYVGWAAGGGYGSFTGYYGVGSDQILGARLVTPSGSVVDTDADNDPELLWALRGAGLGNFGIIVELRTKVYPRPRALAGFLAYPLSEAPTVFANFETLRENLPAAFSGEVLVADPGPGPCVMFSYHWVFDGENRQEGTEFLAKMRALGTTVVLDTVTETTPTEFAAATAEQFRTPGNVSLNSVAVADFSPELADILLRYPPSGACGVLFHSGHGRANVPNPDASFALRKKHLVLGIRGMIKLSPDAESKSESEALDARKAVFEWAATINREIRERGLALDQGYWSFTSSEFCDSLAFFGEETVRRLTRLKEKYNPGNAFPQAFPGLN
ncbi:related to FAD/FMN-containing dehydrogenases [Cephalotrichum gorgonifer]|uniref:Related to FAD/FMN-containing dehydrogenases n=1 Tax=Cephalotrichum gorgonifer TaxID=2041049 RepID=A0AAE8N664_9PEZI|nr:related to FAD/FMN-containing dehydrogenases [Cephalotrichum gorgonifer]